MAVALLCHGPGTPAVAGAGGGIAAGVIYRLYPTIYGGFNLYNGGFVAGIVAFLLVPVLEAFFKERTPSVESPVE